MKFTNDSFVLFCGESCVDMKKIPSTHHQKICMYIKCFGILFRFCVQIGRKKYLQLPKLHAIRDTSDFASTHVVVSVRHPITY